MGEYTSADSLLHSGEAIGFYGLKGYDVVDEVIGQGGKSFTLSIYVISTCGSWARQENTMTWRSFRESVKALWRSLQKRGSECKERKAWKRSSDIAPSQARKAGRA